MKPKKSLGQNFLTSIPARMAIVQAGNVTPTDTVLEVGPGKGFLTRALLDTGAHVVALEKDSDLIPVLSETFNSELEKGRLTLIEGDVLTFNPQAHNLQAGKYKLIANIPYYITGAIISRFLAEVASPSCMVVLIQKEVAERACAKDGKESLLSLSIQAYGEPKVVYRVSRGSFNPIPSVDSAVLQISNISKHRFDNTYHESMFFKVIHAGFAHKRKLLASNLKQVFLHIDIIALFEELGIHPKERAENIDITTWVQLSKRLC
jgi:16S rRNA (adenine1518-N6/adenine1519-N6)-dimethyltransferase